MSWPLPVDSFMRQGSAFKFAAVPNSDVMRAKLPPHKLQSISNYIGARERSEKARHAATLHGSASGCAPLAAPPEDRREPFVIRGTPEWNERMVPPPPPKGVAPFLVEALRANPRRQTHPTELQWETVKRYVGRETAEDFARRVVRNPRGWSGWRGLRILEVGMLGTTELRRWVR